MSDDLKEIANRRICCQCVGESFLRAQLEKQSLPMTTCFYCEVGQDTVSIEELADWIDTAFGEHYTQTPVEPDPISKQRGGEPTIWVLQEAAEIDIGPADDVRRILQDRHFDRHAQKAGEEQPFSESACYALKDPDDVELDSDWRNLEHDLQTGTRFFSRIATIAFDSIFGSLDRLAREDGTSILVEAGPDKPLKRFFRGRVFTTRADLEVALTRPDLELAPPPPRRARNGRMNPPGISVFYGATTEQTALDEVRPPVGSHVLSGEFVLRQSVTLLDVAAFENVFTVGSIFDPAHIRRREQAVFLAKLVRRIVKPVLPDDEPLEYLTTQAMAEYLSQLETPQIDGLLYPSAQSNSTGQNVVLFHRCARTEELDALTSRKVRITSTHDDEAFFVSSKPEKLPPPSEDSWLDIMSPRDHRGFFLALDLASVRLHRVSSISISTQNVLIIRNDK